MRAPTARRSSWRSTRPTWPEIPKDVTVRLLPKTLFGERFVALEVPPNAGGERLADGDTIGQDRSQNAIELQKVIDDTLPLLQAVAAAGPQLHPRRRRRRPARPGQVPRARTWASTGEYFGQVNTVLPQLQADISKLADFADTYEGAADDLLAVLDNLSITNKTLVDQSEQLRRTFTVVGGSSSNVTASFLETNEQNLISLAQTSRPVLGVFAKYSPEYPCLLNGLSRFNPMISQAFGADGDPALNLNITVSLPPRNPYEPGDQPAYIDQSGPAARPDQHRRRSSRPPSTASTTARRRRPTAWIPRTTPTAGNPVCLGGGGPNDVPPGAGEPQRHRRAVLPFHLAGSTAELDFVRSILAYQTGAKPGRGLRPGRRHDGPSSSVLAAGRARSVSVGRAVKGQLRGLAGPLIKLVIFAAGHDAGQRTCWSATITNAGYGEQLTYTAAVHRRRRPRRGRTMCASPGSASARSTRIRLKSGRVGGPRWTFQVDR